MGIEDLNYRLGRANRGSLHQPPLAPTHQQRVIDEKRALDEKHDRLRDFIGREDFLQIVTDKDERERLYRQSSAMAEYSKVLAERIAAF